ncbi:Hypothetical predicted protein [Paramuricea clavata]|uniref:Uncharacterized protein n=1 Tax=Paramuricea clavata TaxID=317549 RepID=A0A7D9DN90_PARCT|nr:Hypothetical predicted protein [Paramuricea clavata]
MVFRRHKALWQVLVLLVFVGITLRYSYNYYNETSLKLKAANIRHHELLEERNSVSRELDGVIESKNNLELSLRTKTQRFAEKKKEWDAERDNLQNRANKEKANFDALDSEYKMVKAKHDDLQIDCEHMKKSFDRLKEDHTKLDTEHRNNFEGLKQKNEKIILALQKQVEHYQKEENLLQLKVQDLQENVAQYQNVVAKLQKKISQDDKGKKDSVTVPEVKKNEIASNVAGKEKLRSKIRRRRAAKESNSKFDANKIKVKNIRDTVSDSDKAQKQKQFLRNLGKLTEVIPEKQDNTNEVSKVNVDTNANNVEIPKAGKYVVDVVRENGGGQKEDNNIERKDENNDNIEVINKDGKDEQNFNLDEQPDLEARERQALAEHNKGEDRLERDKRDADEQVNNDEKSDDEEIALREEDNEDDNADENEENEILEQPENLLLKREEAVQDREETIK